jgi:RNA polymerase sigma-70 factor (ECF subfamily)
MGLQPATIEEVKQQLREHLLVVHGRRSAPLLADYSGAGQLRNWLRVVAVRTATTLVGRLARETPTEDARLERAVGQVRDPELEYFKTLYRAEFKTAFGQALQQLEGRQRTLLRQHLIDGLSIQELSALYHVHKATTARWLQRIRETLLERTRSALREQLGVSPSECQSIMGLIESRLEITLQTYLEGE